jgi:hypothetical protein
MFGRIMLALLLLPAAGRAEAPERVEQSTQGSCSPTIDGTGGNATVVCNGVNPPPPKMTVVVSEGSDVVQLIDFLRKHDGERIDLRVKCAPALDEDVCSEAGFEAHGPVPPNEQLVFLFPKGEASCTIEGEAQDPIGEPEPEGLCDGAWWLYILTDNDAKDGAITQPAGAGSFALYGLFDVRVGVRGGFVPPFVTAVELRAVKS